MNQPQTQQRSRRRGSRRPKQQAPADIWRDAPELPPAQPIVIPDEVSALLRSLGDAPPIGGSAIDGYFVAVVERTAAVAAALASSADLLATPG